MSRGIDATLTTAVSDPITRPYFLVYMGFQSPVRLSTGLSLAWDGYTWLGAGLEISLSDSPTLRVFNETALFGQVVLVDGTAGRVVKIWQGYANDAAHPNPILIFDGEMGAASIAETVIINCKRHGPKRTPRHFAVPPYVNHVPPDGTRFETPKEVIILERD